MAFFDNFSKKVQDVAFVATEKAQQVAAVAGEKANAVADKAKTEYEMASERRSMDKNYRAIGEWYVSTLEGDAPEAVADIVAAIKASQEKLAAYEAAKAEAAAAKKAQELSADFRALTGLRQLMEFLARYDLPVHLAMSLQRAYGDNAIQTLRDDPYILSRDQYGVDFRNTDAIVHVVRCFDNADIIRHECSHDPVSDIETVDLELILADIEMLRRRQDKAEKNAKSGDKKFKKEAEVLGRLIEWMDGGRSARSFEADEEEREIIAASDLLTNKPIIYAANLDEDGFSAGAENNAYYQQVKALADAEGSRVLPVCARFEQEIAELDEEERAVFMEELGMTESGLQRLIQASYELLGLISFLTCGSDECRAWTIRRGTKAPQAAGKIHTDFERGFIRAEIVAFDDLKACGSMAAAKEKGLVRSEGKDYVMNDGDVTLFRFNV